MVLSLIPSPRFKIIIVTDISIYVSSGKGFHRFSESFSILSYPWIIKKKFYIHYQRFKKSLLYIVFFSFDSLEFIIKFGYNARCHWFAEQSLAKTVTPSANLYNIRPFSGRHSSFFFLLIEREISEQASQ